MNASRDSSNPPSNSEIQFRSPRPNDGKAVHDLIEKSDFLDLNSLYCYLIICTHFSRTSVVAEMDGEVVGLITAYIPPTQPDVLFVWQVAVDEKARKRGVARSMLEFLLHHEAAMEVSFIETTVTQDNIASSSLFHSIARKYGAEVEESVMFEREEHFGGLHDSEYKLRIGKLDRNRPVN